MFLKRILSFTQGGRARAEILFSVAANALFLFFVALCFRHQYLLLSYKEFGDESETIVAAKMIASGMRLYSEVFNHHGPLTFLPGVLTEKLGDFGVRGHRVSIAVLQALSIVSIYTSPALKFKWERVLACVASATLVLAYLPDTFGHMYLYQTIAGLFLTIILAQYSIPAILCPEKISPLQIILGNVLIASLPFLAITYLPVAGFSFVSSYRFKHYRHILIGSAIGLAGNLLFLGIYGSFAGFLAFHIYLNVKILPIYSDLQPGGALLVNAISTATSSLAHFISLIALLMGALILVQNEKRFPWRTIFLVAGVVSLLMRGSNFHGMAYFYAILPLIALSFSSTNTNYRASMYVAVAFLVICTLKVSLVLPGDKQKIALANIPTETEFSQLVSVLTEPRDRIIAYSFQNFEYLVSHRLPASGHFFYLPWQERYNLNPKLGISIDACQQIRAAAPKIMLIDKWRVWDRYPWDSYGGCIQDLLDSNYHQVHNRPYYIRDDLWRALGKYFTIKDWRTIPSQPLTEANPIKLKIDDALIERNRNSKIVAIEIMFGTYDRANLGVAQLILEKQAGGTVNVDFSLPQLLDNKYRKFDIPEDSYASGEIKWITGGGISAWEGQGAKNNSLTCMRYVFSDGSRGFTTGCPMF